MYKSHFNTCLIYRIYVQRISNAAQDNDTTVFFFSFLLMTDLMRTSHAFHSLFTNKIHSILHKVKIKYSLYKIEYIIHIYSILQSEFFEKQEELTSLSKESLELLQNDSTSHSNFECIIALRNLERYLRCLFVYE